MKLYHVYQGENKWYDTYSNFVVCAESEDEARDTSPDGGQINWRNWKSSSWANHRESVEVTYLGEADSSVPKGIICCSFHAG